MVPLLLTLFVIICILLIVVVLLQKGRGGGLGAAFGGLGSSAFGTRTGDVFTWVTIVLTFLFLVLAVVTALVIRPESVPAATPVFDPAPTDISEPVKVRITSATAGARIFYTLDQSAPDDTAMLYSKDPVMVEPGQTLKAIAYGLNRLVAPSDVAVGHYGPGGTTQPASGAAGPLLIPEAPPPTTQPAMAEPEPTPMAPAQVPDTLPAP